MIEAICKQVVGRQIQFSNKSYCGINLGLLVCWRIGSTLCHFFNTDQKSNRPELTRHNREAGPRWYCVQCIRRAINSILKTIEGFASWTWHTKSSPKFYTTAKIKKNNCSLSSLSKSNFQTFKLSNHSNSLIVWMAWNWFDLIPNLRSLMTPTNDVSLEIQRRIQTANRCFFGLRKHLKSSHLSWQTKFTIHKTLIRPVLLYGSKTGGEPIARIWEKGSPNDMRPENQEEVQQRTR
jgi:hypothetical protein